MQPELREILAYFHEVGYNRGVGEVRTGEAHAKFDLFLANFAPGAWDGVMLVRVVDEENTK